MQLTKSNSSGVTVLVIQGSLDGTTSPQLEAELQGPIQAKDPRVVLDFAQVPLVSSAALRVLLSAAKRMKKHGGRIRLCALRPEVKQVFDISDLTAFFDILPDQAAALQVAGSAPAASAPSAPPPAASAPPVSEPEQVPARRSPVAESSPGAANAVPPPVPPPQPEPATTAKLPPPPAPVEAKPSPPPVSEVVPPPPAEATSDDSDPGATLCYPPAPKRRPEPAPPVAPLAESPSSVGLRPAPAVPPVPPVNPPLPSPAPSVAPPLPPAASHAAPPIPGPTTPPPPPAPVAPTTPLRRTAPAVIAKAVSASEQPPSVPPPPPFAAPAPPSTGAAVHVQRREPHADAAPARQPRSILPILAAIVVAAAVFAWLALHLLFGKKHDSGQTVQATPSPSPSPVIEVAATPSPTLAPEIAAASPSPSATVKPTPSPSPAVVAVATPPPRIETPPPTPTPPQSATPAETRDGVASAAGPIDTTRTNPENQAVREAVLHRISAMPLSQADKDRLYTALDRSRGLGKLVTISFPNGRTNVSANDVASLNAALHRPATQRFLDDPSVVLVVLGFADVKGNDKSNKDVSELRARRVVEALRGPCNVANMIHSIGMGGQSLAGETLEKNRVVEVWAVLP